jgi:hypothetical protein
MVQRVEIIIHSEDDYQVDWSLVDDANYIARDMDGEWCAFYSTPLAWNSCEGCPDDCDGKNGKDKCTEGVDCWIESGGFGAPSNLSAEAIASIKSAPKRWLATILERPQKGENND